MSAAPVSIDDLQIIDTDSHISEPHDLWSSRAPAGWRDRLPRVEEIDGVQHWVVDRDVDLGRAGAVSVVDRAGNKVRGTEFIEWTKDDAHVASYDMRARLDVLDRFGIHAQVIYPNLAGFGNQNFVKLDLHAQPGFAGRERPFDVVMPGTIIQREEGTQRELGETVIPDGSRQWCDVAEANADAGATVTSVTLGHTPTLSAYLDKLSEFGEEVIARFAAP